MEKDIRHEVYKKPKLLRRICASIIDMIIVFSLSILLNLLLPTIYKNSNDYKNTLKIYDDFVVSTNMYYYDGDTIVQNKEHLDEEDYENFIINYIDNGSEEVNKIKDEFNNQTEITSYNTFIESKIFDNYVNKAVRNNENANKASTRLAGYFYFSIVIAIFIACLFTYILIPLLNKDGKTAGKILFHLRLISNKGQVKVKKIQIIFRELVKTILELVSSVLISLVFFIPLPLIVSFVIMLFNKNQQTLHDILCSTIVVDEDEYGDIKENEKIVLSIVTKEDKLNAK